MTKFALALLFGSAVAGFALPASAQAPATKTMPAPAMKSPAPATTAPATHEAAPAPGIDMTKMGPLSRKVTKEDKKGVAETYKAWDEAWKKGDVNALADMVDYPVIMMSDDAKGEEKNFEASREQFVGMMQGFANMPKDMKITARHAPTFISDSLVVSVNNNSLSMGKVHGTWHSFDVLTLVDGKWKFKQICEAGWGDMAGAANMAPGMAKPAAAMMAPAKPMMAPGAKK